MKGSSPVWWKMYLSTKDLASCGQILLGKALDRGVKLARANISQFDVMGAVWITTDDLLWFAGGTRCRGGSAEGALQTSKH
jgi:hypothetical protein